jgi:hypothetical protein
MTKIMKESNLFERTELYCVLVNDYELLNVHEEWTTVQSFLPCKWHCMKQCDIIHTQQM